MTASVEFYTFVHHLPEEALEYAVECWDAAVTHGVDPWHLVAILWRESLAGTAPGYSPKNSPEGTGDRIPRRAGGTYTQLSGKVYTIPASGLPEDGQGWGRGLMQIDWGVHHEWCLTGVWKTAAGSFDYAAKLLADIRRALGSAGPCPPAAPWRLEHGLPQYKVQPWKGLYPLLHAPINPRPLSGIDLDRAALAAYNAGIGGVLQALSVGAPAEAATAGQNYVTWCEKHIANWKGNTP